MAKLYLYNDFQYGGSQYEGNLGLPIEYDDQVPFSTEPVELPGDDWIDIGTAAFFRGWVGLKADGKLWGAGDGAPDEGFVAGLVGPDDIYYSIEELPFEESFTHIYSSQDDDTGGENNSLWFRSVSGNLYGLGDNGQPTYLGFEIGGVVYKTTYPEILGDVPASDEFIIYSDFSGNTRLIADGSAYFAGQVQGLYSSLGEGIAEIDYGVYEETFVPVSMPIVPQQFASSNQREHVLDSDGTLYTYEIDYVSGDNYIFALNEVASDVIWIESYPYSGGIFYITSSGNLYFLDSVTGGSTLAYDDQPIDRVWASGWSQVVFARVAATKELLVWDAVSYGSEELPLEAPTTILVGTPIEKVQFIHSNNAIALILTEVDAVNKVGFWENLKESFQY